MWFWRHTVLAAMVPCCAQAQLDLYVDRPPTNAEVSAHFSGAKHEPKFGCYLGAYIDLDNTITSSFVDQTGKPHKLPAEFESATGKSHAGYFFYMGYGRALPKDWVSQLEMQNKIVHIALEPNRGLEYVIEDNYLRQLADDMRDTGAKILLRFASEMNGPWVGYHGDPALYKEKFRLVHKVMAERAPNVAMVWCPYTTPEGNTPAYYPGDDAVDWVGVNMYSVTYFNQDRRTPALHIHPTQMLDSIYRKYSTKKPIMIGEYGATHYSALEGKPQTEFAIQAIRGLYAALPRAYPRVKAVFYFNGNNMELEHRLNNNYAVTQEKTVLSVYRSLIAPRYFLGEVPVEPGLLVPGYAKVRIDPVDGVEHSDNPAAPQKMVPGQELKGVVTLSSWARRGAQNLKIRFVVGGERLGPANNNGETFFDSTQLPNGPIKITVEGWVGQRRVVSKTMTATVAN